MMQHMITTVDNPYDPFTHFDEWDAWDRAEGYCTTAYLARVVTMSDELSEGDQMVATEEGIDEIIKYDPFDIYIKVSKDVPIDNRPSTLVKEIDNSVSA